MSPRPMLVWKCATVLRPNSVVTVPEGGVASAIPAEIPAVTAEKAMLKTIARFMTSRPFSAPHRAGHLSVDPARGRRHSTFVVWCAREGGLGMSLREADYRGILSVLDDVSSAPDLGTFMSRSVSLLHGL